MKNLMKDKNLILGVCMFIFALIVLYQTQFLFDAKDYDPIGPAGWPRMLSLILLFLSILFILTSLTRKKIDVADFSIRKNSLIVITFVSLALYIFLMPRLGFVFSSFIFLWFLQYILTPGKKKYIIITLISILFPIVMNYIFREFLGVFLPTL